MNASTHTIRRLRRAIALALAVAGFAVPTALAGNAPDAFERAVAAQQSQLGTYPDDRAVIRGANPTGLGTQVGIYSDDRPVIRGANPTGLGTQVGIYSDDRPVIRGANPTGLGLVPDVFERTVAAGESAYLGTPSIPVSSDGFDWGDFGIGAGAMLGFLMLLVGLGAGALTVRHKGGQLRRA